LPLLPMPRTLSLLWAIIITMLLAIFSSFIYYFALMLRLLLIEPIIFILLCRCCHAASPIADCHAIIAEPLCHYRHYCHYFHFHFIIITALLFPSFHRHFSTFIFILSSRHYFPFIFDIFIIFMPFSFIFDYYFSFYHFTFHYRHAHFHFVISFHYHFRLSLFSLFSSSSSSFFLHFILHWLSPHLMPLFRHFVIAFAITTSLFSSFRCHYSFSLHFIFIFISLALFHFVISSYYAIIFPHAACRYAERYYAFFTPSYLLLHERHCLRFIIHYYYYGAYTLFVFSITRWLLLLVIDDYCW
jgi:hypothetical protein